jgi:PTH1 family peptidyl-tRNA hydrolase
MRYLLVGLGNPGQEYAQTRHNAGFWLADCFADANECRFAGKAKFSGQLGQVNIGGSAWVALKPTTFMNRSGVAVRQVSQYYDIPVNNILVAHDELDFEPGVIRFKRGGGHGGHNGLRDIIAQLGSADFARLRIGVGRGQNMADYVLKSPSKRQRIEIDGVLTVASDLMVELMGINSQKAVQVLHGL